MPSSPSTSNSPPLVALQRPPGASRASNGVAGVSSATRGRAFENRTRRREKRFGFLFFLCSLKLCFFRLKKTQPPKLFEKNFTSFSHPLACPTASITERSCSDHTTGSTFVSETSPSPLSYRFPIAVRIMSFFFLIFFKGEENSRSEFDHFRSSGKRRGEKMKNKLTLPIAFCSVALNGFPLLFDSVAGSRSVV
jgi:hypothetical protein